MMNYNPKIIDFFKKHNMYDKRLFEYLQANSTMIDNNDEEQRSFIGCFYLLDKNDKLIKLQLCLPYVSDYKTALISIHEITHGIENYYKLGHKFKKDITIEALPLLYEKLYILENPTEELISYGIYLDSLIMIESEKEYKFALQIREELLKKYNKDMQKSIKLIKKISRKY